MFKIVLLNISSKYAISFLVGAWFFISAFYYAPNFFSGNLLVSVGEDGFHRLFKYVVSFLVCLAGLIYFRVWVSVFVYFFIFLVFFVFFIWHLHGYDVLYSLGLFLVIFSFVGYSMIVSRMTCAELNVILVFFVFSSFLVSLISFFEYFFMWPVLGDYWFYTGGYRSISTLLNPNNLGVYLGASLVILMLLDKFGSYLRFMMGGVIFTALLMSGSRTALLSLMVSLYLAWCLRCLKGGRKNLLLLMFSSSVMLVAILLIGWGVIGDFLVARGLDSAYIRIEKYIYFISAIDGSYFFPDFAGERFFYTSENSYFHILNALGGVFFLMLFMVMIFFNLDFKRCRESAVCGALSILFFYYLVASCFENVFVSFPNNQLFFLAAGVFIRPIRLFGSKGFSKSHELGG